jgi:hypothetical protein
MDELQLVAQLRDNYPAGIDLTEAERRLYAEFRPVPSSAGPSSAVGGTRRARRTQAAGSRRRFGPKLVATGAIAAAVAVGAVIALQGGPAHPAAKGGSAGASADPRGLQLASYATQAAASAPAWQPSQWVYSDILRPEAWPKPGATNPTITWTQVDGDHFAYLEDGNLVINDEGPLTSVPPVFWSNVTAGDMYSYLLSLPTNPAALRAVIVNNLEAAQEQRLKVLQKSDATAAQKRLLGAALGFGNSAVFTAISVTLQDYVLPPKLLAAVYVVLAEDPVVHFDKSVTDNAGQTGVGFYTVNGSSKSEIMINPSTYAYMGHDSVSNTQSYWTDLVSSGIVQQAGQTP